MIRRRYTGRVVDAAILFLALVTWACFQLGLNLATTDFGFLIAIVLLSLFDGFVSSVSSRSLPSVASTTSSWRSPASRTLLCWPPSSSSRSPLRA